MVELNDLAKQIHETAKSKGWWDEERSPLEIHMLIVSEIAEATEAARNQYFHGELSYVKDKPEGEAVELVDAVIRILDYFGRKGWDFERVLKNKMKYNETREYRHGGKRF